MRHRNQVKCLICLVQELNFNFQQISSRIHVAVIILKMELAEHRHAYPQQPPGVKSFHMPSQPWELWNFHGAHLIKSKYALCSFAQALKMYHRRWKPLPPWQVKMNVYSTSPLGRMFLRNALFICKIVTKLEHLSETYS